ncbi:MAG: MFS transporter [Patescibacteria group bacterium]|nr:MFS transporter [Patescibacteria group bacterium]
MLLNRHYHINFKHYFESPLSKLELSVWLLTFGRSLVSIFIPIILLQMGFSLTNVILFFVILNIIDLPLNLLSKRLIIKYGAVRIIFLGIIFSIISLIILYFGDLNFNVLIVLAIALAGYDAFYWVAHWFVFNECIVLDKKTGKKVSSMMIVRNLAVLIAPLIGAGMLIFLNKNYLLIISIAIILSSLLPLLKLDLKYTISDKRMKWDKFFSYKKNIKDYIFIFLRKFNDEAELVILPIFIFITFKSIESIGLISAIAMTISILSTYLVGKWTDKFNNNFLILLGSLFLGIVWILRLAIPTISIIYITTIFVGFLVVLLNIPIDSNLIRNSKKTSMIEVSTYRNFIGMLGSFLFYLILFFSVKVFNLSFTITALAMFSLSLISALVIKFKKW